MAYYKIQNTTSTGITLKDFHDSMDIYGGGTANETTVNGHANIQIYRGGVANSSILSNRGWLWIHSGGVANSTVNNDGALEVSSGGVANSTFINYRGDMTIYNSGVANFTTVNDGGILDVSSGGIANSTTVNKRGYMTVFESGVANFTTVNSDGDMNVSNGGTANDTILFDYGRMHVTEHGIANVTTVNDGGEINVSDGGVANSTTINAYGDMDISYQGVANFTTVNSDGDMNVWERGVANTTIVNNGGYMEIWEHGVANSTTVKDGGIMSVNSGGKVTGTLTMANGAIVTTEKGAVIDFDISTLSHGNDVRVNDLSLIQGTPSYTVTVSESQTAGVYRLAGGATGFDKTIILVDTTGTQYSTLTVGDTYDHDNNQYALKLDGDVLALTLNLFIGELFDETKDITLNIMASGVNVNKGGVLNILSGGRAENTTVNSGGSLNVSNGGTANLTTVNSGGNLNVSNGGTANYTTVVNGGSMAVSSGGTATGSLTIAEGAVVSVADGGVVELGLAGVSPYNTPLVNDLSLIQGNPSYAIDASPSMARGKYNLADGAYGFNKAITLSEQQLSPDGVLRDGDALYTLAEESDRLQFTVWNNKAVSQFEISQGLRELKIRSKDCCVGATITSSAGFFEMPIKVMQIYSGGMAYSTNINKYGYGYVSSGGTAHTTTITGNGTLYAMNGAKVVSTTIGYTGNLVIYGGTVKSTTVRNGGWMEVEGGKITGTLTIEDGGTVRVNNQVVLDFDISPLSPGNAALVNDLSRITGTPTFTVTARPGQATGVYRLAGGAAGFSSTLTVKCAKEADVTLRVGDECVEGDNLGYALAVTDGQLLLTVIDITPPEKPVATADITTPTNQDVTVTATFSDDSVKRKFSLDGNEWQDYEQGIVMEDNGTVWFRAADEAGNVSEASYEVTNIDKIAPDAPTFHLSGDSVSHEVILHAIWDKDDAVCRYAINGAATMHEYIKPLRFSEHTRIHFQTEDAVGNKSDSRVELMFGRVTGVWSDRFFAYNCMVEGIEQVPLEGMNIIGDVFYGTDDATLLLLTDDANGDALFLDDIYSASPDVSTKVRISQVNEIIAGGGDDIIDLTSGRFSSSNGITVQGGDGNDVIWANDNGNWLFGDAGDDRIVGGADTDIIAGGLGNDILNGGGGDDYFCFGGNWGDDTIEQLDGGRAMLLFDDVKKKDMSLSADAAGNAVLSCDSGSVTLSGVRHDDVSASFDDDDLKLSDNLFIVFGDSDLNQDFQSFADMLHHIGAFQESTSDIIFDDKDRGMLA